MKPIKIPKEETLRYRLKDKTLTVCGVCFMGSDGMKVKTKEAELLRKNDDRITMCENCKKHISSGVKMNCIGEDCQTKNPCNSFYILDTEMIKKYVPDAENGNEFDIYGCPKCSPSRKIHLTRESLIKDYEEFNNKSGFAF